METKLTTQEKEDLIEQLEAQFNGEMWHSRPVISEEAKMEAEEI